jgi:hypothetical protein
MGSRGWGGAGQVGAERAAAVREDGLHRRGIVQMKPSALPDRTR